jgi:hypothetical protein
MISTAHPHPILAIFSNSSDEAAFVPLLEGFCGLATIINPPGKELLFQKTGSLHLKPSLLIISSRLYPENRPELVADLREIYPEAEILLITQGTDPLPPLERISVDRIRHLLVTPTDDDRKGISSLQEAIIKLLVKSPWVLLDYVKPGTRIHKVKLTSSEEKEELITLLENAICGDSPEMEFLRQRAALLADEMVENALYGAPRDHNGRKLYFKGESRAIDDTEKIIFCFAFDGETLAMEIADGWGTLVPEMVIDYLARNQAGIAEVSEDAGGRGLFIIWRFLDHLHVTIRPGMQTVLGGLLKADSPFDCDSPKGFSISTDYL